MMYNPFFIIGAQRSGTTLLRLMLNAHSKVAIPEEATFWMPLLSNARINDTLNQRQCKHFLSYILLSKHFKLWCLDGKEYADEVSKIPNITLSVFISKLYEHYTLSRKKRIWGDKTPSFFRMIPVLDTLFPNARFIHIARDGRDVFLSWREFDPSKGNISAVALEWKIKVRKIHKSLAALHPERYMQIRYEDLVSGPGLQLEKICTFLGIEFEDGMLDFWQTSSKFIGKHHSALIFKPVTTSSVERWRKELKTEQIRRFECVAGKLLSSMGYTPLGSKGDFFTLCAVIVDFCFGIPVRVLQVIANRLNAFLAAHFGIKILKEKTGEKPADQGGVHN